MLVTDLQRRCRSYRSFDESRPVTRDHLLTMLETARVCSSGMNRQPLKYRLVTEREETEALVAGVRWAALLQESLPPEGHHPTAFLVICHDLSVCPEGPMSGIDVGLAAEAILLTATEMGFGGCMFGTFSPAGVKELLHLPDTMSPRLVIALGTPDEVVRVTTLPDDGSTAYYREDGVHFVPKRDLLSSLID